MLLSIKSLKVEHIMKFKMLYTVPVIVMFIFSVAIGNTFPCQLELNDRIEVDTAPLFYLATPAD